MSGQIELLDRPTLATGYIGNIEAWKEAKNFGAALCVTGIVDPGAEARRIRRNIIFNGYRQVKYLH